ncbi:hypothetical protein D9M71_419400 [compost metagenome]
MRQMRSSGNASITAVSVQTVMLIGLDQRISRPPLEIDRARRRFCSIRPPRIKPSSNGDRGKSSLRRI